MILTAVSICLGCKFGLHKMIAVHSCSLFVSCCAVGLVLLVYTAQTGLSAVCMHHANVSHPLLHVFLSCGTFQVRLQGRAVHRTSWPERPSSTSCEPPIQVGFTSHSALPDGIGTCAHSTPKVPRSGQLSPPLFPDFLQYSPAPGYMESITNERPR